jgi:hypothetical protein
MEMKTFKQLMTEMTLDESIGDAVTDLVDTIKNDGYSKGIEDEIAADYDVNPALLIRMFKQKYSKEPKDYKISKNDDEKGLQVAIRKAKESRKKFGVTGDFEEYVGKVFERKGRENTKYVFIAYTKQGIHAIRFPDFSERIISFQNRREASAFLRQNIM